MPPENVPHDVLREFGRFMEWRSTLLRSMRLPELSYIWEIHSGHAIPVTAGHCIERSTKPKPVTKSEVFGFAFTSLPEHVQITCLLSYIDDVPGLKEHLSRTVATDDLRTGRHYRSMIAEAWEEVGDLMVKLGMI